VSTWKWIVGGFAAGLAAKKLFGSKSASATHPVSPPISGVFTVLGRPTYLHAPAGAERLMVYFHGFSTNVATRGPKLAAVLDDAPVALVMPQLGPKSEPGDLSTRMAVYLDAVKKTLGFDPVAVDGVSHSGGYRALSALIQQTNVSGVALFDSLYGEYSVFANGKFQCLIDIYGTETEKLSEELREEKRADSRYQFYRTSTFHNSIPEKYIGQVAHALPLCRKIAVTS
jgi:hypothetical protein